MRVSEVYASTQGEGPNVGSTTVFVRFGGCNLRCPGWPCDTQHAIDPQYRFQWQKQTPEELLKQTRKVAELAGAKIITLTGGEPFLQKSDELQEFVAALRELNFGIDCFSNGTIPYPDWAFDDIHFIMDWKLPGSGEDHLNEARIENLKGLDESILHPQCVKFVCKNWADVYAATSLYDSYLTEYESTIEVYYGRVWDGEISNAELVGFVLENQLPWKLNLQTHNMIWDPQERGR